MKWPQMRPGGFFPTDQNLAGILGRTDLHSDNFIFLVVFGFQIPGFLDFQIPGFPDSRPSAVAVAGCGWPQLGGAPRDQIWEIQGSKPRP